MELSPQLIFTLALLGPSQANIPLTKAFAAGVPPSATNRLATATADPALAPAGARPADRPASSPYLWRSAKSCRLTRSSRTSSASGSDISTSKVGAIDHFFLLMTAIIPCSALPTHRDAGPTTDDASHNVSTWTTLTSNCHNDAEFRLSPEDHQQPTQLTAIQKSDLTPTSDNPPPHPTTPQSHPPGAARVEPTHLRTARPALSTRTHWGSDVPRSPRRARAQPGTRPGTACAKSKRAQRARAPATERRHRGRAWPGLPVRAARLGGASKHLAGRVGRGERVRRGKRQGGGGWVAPQRTRGRRHVVKDRR